MIDQGALQLLLPCLLGKREELKVVWVLHDLLRELRLTSRHGAGEIRERLALAAIQAALDLVNQNIGLQPFWMVARMYHSRSAGLFTLSKMTQLWNQGICAATCCTICSSGHASANVLIYLRLRGEKPFISRNALRRSSASRSITFAPYPFSFWRARMSRPILQYKRTSSRLTASAALTWAARMRSVEA